MRKSAAAQTRAIDNTNQLLRIHEQLSFVPSALPSRPESQSTLVSILRLLELRADIELYRQQALYSFLAITTSSTGVQRVTDLQPTVRWLLEWKYLS